MLEIDYSNWKQLKQKKKREKKRIKEKKRNIRDQQETEMPPHRLEVIIEHGQSPTEEVVLHLLRDTELMQGGQVSAA